MNNDDKTKLWPETRVIERDGYQLRSASEVQADWHTILIVMALVVVLAVVAADAFSK